jgi:hypothetical protein
MSLKLLGCMTAASGGLIIAKIARSLEARYDIINFLKSKQSLFNSLRVFRTRPLHLSQTWKAR